MGAFEEASCIDDYYEDDMNDDVDLEYSADAPKILLTRAKKLQIREPWRASLIMKLFGKSLKYYSSFRSFIVLGDYRVKCPALMWETASLLSPSRIDRIEQEF